MSVKSAKILILEEDNAFRKLLQLELAYNSFQVEASADVVPSVQTVATYNPSLILCGIEPPSSLELFQNLRAAGYTCWIVAMSKHDSVGHKVQCLDAGADDYIVKPFANEELMAKLRAMLRRLSHINQDGMLEYSDLQMDLINRQVIRQNKLIELRAKEFDLLKVFLMHPEQVLSREFIFDQVWGSSFLGDSNVIEVYIRYLRSKLGKPGLIKTKRGSGYLLISEEARINQAKIMQEE